MCNEPATSREHVPPSCFFPEKNEFRKNLITVPSCVQHNLVKSGDDEYLFAVISSHLESNQIAQDQFKKTIKAIKRRSRLATTFFKNMRPIQLGDMQTGVFHIDKERFDKSFDHISRGIYYHHFKKRIERPSATMSYALFADSTSKEAAEMNKILLQWREYSTRGLAQSPKYGENPAVYYYQVIKDNDSEGVAIRHVFYEGVVTDVLFEA